ncbi:universal stress protein [Massilia sp. H-1]|nr:universal stress protein [Massilia sp. H-1]
MRLGRILVAWDGGREAARAAAGAAAAAPGRAGRHRRVRTGFRSASAGRRRAGRSARPAGLKHGITAALAVHGLGQHRMLSRRNEVGERLLAVVSAAEADLIVMGAYGHSRFHEAILGGVTRTVLEASAVPLLMAH